MKISDDLENKIQHARRATANAAAKKALDGHSIEEELAQLETYDRLIKLFPSSGRRNLIAASIIGGLCVFFAGLAWAWHVPYTHISVTATTRAITFRLTEPLQFLGSWQLDGESGLSVGNFAELTLPRGFTPQVLKGRALFEVLQGQVIFSEFRLGENGVLTILREDPTLHLLASNASLRGQAQVFGQPSVVAGSMGETATLNSPTFPNTPGVVSFFDDGKPNLAVRIDVRPKDEIVLRNIKIDMLSLSRDESGTGEFVSGIESGVLTIGETSEKFELTYEDQLNIGTFKGVIKELHVGPGLLRISFDGRAGHVSIGSGGLRKNLVPTWLTYIYNQPHPGFLWGSVVFLWSVLWSARELFFK
jgi:hypothetical protein